MSKKNTHEMKKMRRYIRDQRKKANAEDPSLKPGAFQIWRKIIKKSRAGVEYEHYEPMFVNLKGLSGKK